MARSRNALAATLAALTALPGLTAAEADGGGFLPWPRTIPQLADAGSPWAVPADAGAIDRDGFVRIVDGRLHTERGGRLRLFGINVSFSAMFPDGDEAVRMADHIARAGFNAVRVVSIDHVEGTQAPWLGLWGPDGELQRGFDAGQLARLDRFLALLRERGIRLVLNLHFNRRYPATDLVDPAETRAANIKYSKGVDQLDPGMMELQRRYATDLLTHVNPHTGRALAADPQVALVEINNENSAYDILWHKGRLPALPPRLLAHLDAQWGPFLRTRHRTAEALRAAWGGQAGILAADWDRLEVPRQDPRRLPAPVQADLGDFLRGLELAYWRTQFRFVKDVLGVRVPVTGTQMDFTWQDFAREFDYVAAHAYWHHPEFPAGEWDLSSGTVWNLSMAASDADAITTRLGSARLAGKPFIVGEYGHAWPNDYRAEAPVLLGVIAALQDWDGIFHFNYQNEIVRREQVDYFCFNNAFLRQHSLPFSALAFRDGAIAPLGPAVAVPLGVDQAVASAQAGHPLPLRGKGRLPQGFMTGARTAIALQDGPGSALPPVPAPDPRITWRTTGDQARSREAVFAYDDRRCKAWIGWPGDRGIRLSGLEADDVRSANGWCVATLANRDGDIGRPGRHLLTLASSASYTGAQVVDRRAGNRPLAPGDHHGMHIGGMITDRTRQEERIEILPARIRLLAAPGATGTLQALQADGSLSAPVPVQAGPDGWASFSVGGPAARSVSYVITLR